MTLPYLFRLTSFWHSINLFRLGFDALITLLVLAGIYIAWALIKYYYRYSRRKDPLALLELTFPADNHKSAFATEQLYILLHTQSKRRGLIESFFGYKKTFSLELVSTAKDGIRYMIVVPEKEQDSIHRSLLSYLPGIKVRKIEDYIPENNSENKQLITELKLSGDFVLPLRDQKVLNEYDPIAYLTGHMTKLSKDELISFQIVFTPVLASTHRSIIKRIKYIRNLIYYHANLSDAVGTRHTSNNAGRLIFLGLFGILETVVKLIISIPQLMFDYRSNNIPIFQTDEVANTKDRNPYEEELEMTIKSKISQNLFETSLRILITGKHNNEARIRASELVAAFRPLANANQSIEIYEPVAFISPNKQRYQKFRERKLANSIFRSYRQKRGGLLADFNLLFALN